MPPDPSQPSASAAHRRSRASPRSEERAPPAGPSDADSSATPGPAERALEALSEKHASPTRRLFSPALLRELALRARFEVDPVKPDRVRSTIVGGALPDCPSCPNVCCSGYENLVSLRLKDIAVLLDQGRADVISSKKPRFPEALLERRPGLRVLSESRLFRALPVLRQVGPARRCAALVGDRSCGLYPHWPTSCARFPYTLTSDRRRVVWSTRCPVERPEPNPTRSQALFAAALATYNERIRDAVLLAHAERELDALGLGVWLCRAGEDPFES